MTRLRTTKRNRISVDDGSHFLRPPWYNIFKAKKKKEKFFHDNTSRFSPRERAEIDFFNESVQPLNR